MTEASALPPETSDVIAFAASPQSNLLSALFCGGFAILCAFLLWKSDKRADFDMLAVGLGVPLFAYVALHYANNLRRGRETMMAIGARGLFDWRISDAWIPWSAIQSVRMRTYRRYWPFAVRYFTIRLDPAFAARFPVKRLFAISRTLSKTLEGSELTFGTPGTEATHERLAQAFDRFFPQWRSDAE